MTVESGTYNGSITKSSGTLAISGGNYITNSDISTYYADGYSPTSQVINGQSVITDKAVMYTTAAGVSSFTDAIPNSLSDGTYTLLKDVTRTLRMAYGNWSNNVIIDLNGHTLTSTVSDYALTMGRTGSESSPRIFNLVSSNGAGTLKVNVPNSNSTAAINVSGKYNTITIGENVTVDGGCVALLGENETLTVNGTINGGNDFAVATNGSSTKNTTITINDGAVLTSDVTALYLPGNEGVSATINGGTITGGDAGIEVRAGNLVVNGGTITTTATEYNYTANGNGTTTKGAAIAVVQHNTLLPTDAQILGGTLTGLNQIAVVDAQNNNLDGVTIKAKDDFVATTVLPDAFKWESNGDGTSSLATKTYVAQIGDVKYESLEDAWNAVQDGETITLLKDCAGNGIKTKAEGAFTQGVTIDFGGFTYTMDGAMVGSAGTQTQAFQLLKDNKITFKNGTIYSEKAKMLVQNYSNLTLEGMTLTLDNPNYAYAYTLSNNNGTVVIDGTTINANPAGSTAFDVCRGGGGANTYLSVNVTVKGESVINGDIEIDAKNGDPKEGLGLALESGSVNGNLKLTSGGTTVLTDHSDKAVVTKKDAVELSAPAGFKWVSNGDGTSTLKPCEYICAIGSVKYETLAEAVAAAGTSETTITLLEEAAVDGVISGTGVVVPSGSNITFDLNGLTYNVTGSTVGSTGTETQGFQLLKESNITFKNGTLKATSPTAQMVIQNYSNLTLEDVTIDGTGLSGWAYALSNNCGTINLTGSTSIIAKEGGRAFDTCKFGSYDIPTVNINTTGTIIGPIEATGGKLNIVNGKFDVTWVTDSHYAEGDIQISGGVFTEKPAVEYCAEGYVPSFNTDPETKADYPYAVKSKTDDVYELIDGEDYPFMDLPSDITVSSVTYKRTFSGTQVNKHQAWFVPMDYTITADDVENFTFYKLHMVAGAAVPGEANANSIYLYVTPMAAGDVLKGNRPYTIKPKSAVTDHVFTAENTKLYAPNTGSRLNVTTSSNSYDFYGKYVRESYSGSVGDWYSLSGGSLHPNNPTTTFLPYRWIIKVTKNGTNDGYSKVEFSIVEDGDATGIDSSRIINSDDVEGIYTTNGMKVDEPVRGINIIRYKNGKTQKIIVK